MQKSFIQYCDIVILYRKYPSFVQPKVFYSRRRIVVSFDS